MSSMFCDEIVVPRLVDIFDRLAGSAVAAVATGATAMMPLGTERLDASRQYRPATRSAHRRRVTAAGKERQKAESEDHP